MLITDFSDSIFFFFDDYKVLQRRERKILGEQKPQKICIVMQMTTVEVSQLYNYSLLPQRV